MKNNKIVFQWILGLFMAMALCITVQNMTAFATDTGNTGETADCDHKWNFGTITAQPTCTEPGTITYKCLKCSGTKTEEVAPVHSWNTGNTTAQPTCTEPGEKVYTCSKCKKTRTEEIPPNGHSWGNGKTTAHRTCTEPGEKVYTCSKCKETKTEEIPPSHTWDNGKITTQATCDKPGVKTYTCSKCKGTKTEEIPAKGTTPFWYKSRVTKKPTCTTTGIQEYRCLTCDETRTEKIPIDKNAHKWTSKVTKPTKTKKGACTIICELCAKKKETSKLLLGKIAPPMNCGKYAEVYSTSIPKNIYLLSQIKRNTEVYVYEKHVVDNNFTFYKILYSHSGGNTAYVLSSYVSILTDEKRAPDRVKWAKSVINRKKITLNWKADDYATGYQIVYATNGKFKGKKTININKGTTTKTTIKKLKPQTNYCVKIRAYRKVNGKKLYGPYSKMIVPRTKK
ncbi:MAG: fibronectin type III domain-containing protein [Lachnospiraceae bacterium]|nr:fibronectin type III domain-containing protein [Lachnospiraceae bacterium]